MIRTMFRVCSALCVVVALVAMPGCGGSTTEKDTPAKSGHHEGDGHDHSKDKAGHHEGDGHDHSKDADDHSDHDHEKEAEHK
jgi:hypothetical protein